MDRLLFIVFYRPFFRLFLSLGFLIFSFYGSLGTCEYYIFLIFLALFFWFYRVGYVIVYGAFLVWFQERSALLKHVVSYKSFYILFRVCFFLVLKICVILNYLLSSIQLNVMSNFFEILDLSVLSFTVLINESSN